MCLLVAKMSLKSFTKERTLVTQVSPKISDTYESPKESVRTYIS